MTRLRRAARSRRTRNKPRGRCNECKDHLLKVCETALSSNGGEQVRVTSVEDGHNTVRDQGPMEMRCTRSVFRSLASKKARANVGVRNLPDAEQLTSSSTKSDVGALVVVDGSLGKHGVVLDLGLAQRRRVSRDEYELSLARAHVLESALKAEGDLTRLDDKLELGVDVVLGRLLSLRSHGSVGSWKRKG